MRIALAALMVVLALQRAAVACPLCDHDAPGASAPDPLGTLLIGGAVLLIIRAGTRALRRRTAQHLSSDLPAPSPKQQ